MNWVLKQRWTPRPVALHSTIDKMSFGHDSTARKGDSDREVKGDSVVSKPKGRHFVCVQCKVS